MTKIFKCKTTEAYNIKILSELLANNLKEGSFDISDHGITLRMFDNPRKTMIDLELLSENFPVYRFKNMSKMCIGLNLNHFHSMLKNIMKKDSVQLYIDSKFPNELSIMTIPKDNVSITTSAIRFHKVRDIRSKVPCKYNKPVIIPSSEFQKMVKQLSTIPTTDIQVVAKSFGIKFSANADGILKREIAFGPSMEDDDSDDEDETIYEGTFATDQLSRLTKLSGLSKTLQIFPGSNNNPLLFRTSVGSLGKVSVFVKSKEAVEYEKENESEDESEGDSDDESVEVNYEE